MTIENKSYENAKLDNLKTKSFVRGRSIIDTVTEELEKTGLEPRSTDARKWLSNKARELYNINRNYIVTDRSRILTNHTQIKPGMMFFFYYNPKGKADLPYYDAFPLVIPIEKYNDGFLGLNLHYMYPKYRALLLDRLNQFATNKSFDERTRYRITYDFVAGFSKLEFALPTVKRYLYSHMKSKLLKVSAPDWDTAIYLPAEQFKKASKYTVFKESRKAAFGTSTPKTARSFTKPQSRI